jgi:hypothetical protein
MPTLRQNTQYRPKYKRNIYQERRVVPPGVRDPVNFGLLPWKRYPEEPRVWVKILRYIWDGVKP